MDGDIEMNSDQIVINGATDVLILARVEPSDNMEISKVPDMMKDLSLYPTNYAELLDAHKKIHKELFERVSIDLGVSKEDRMKSSEELLEAGGSNPALIEKIFDAARYNVICATGINPPNLQGIWGATMTPPWSGDYTTNGNLPVVISHYLQANTPELMLPLFDRLEAYMEDFKVNARELYNCRGIHVPSRFSSHGLNNHLLDHELLKTLKIGTSITYTYKDQNTRRDPLNMCNKIVPLSKPYDENGEVVRFPAPGYNSQTNPLVDDVEGAIKDNTKGTRFFGSLYANWNITKDLLFRTTLGVDAQNSRRGYYCSANSLDGEGKDSKSLKEHTIQSGITWENILTYSKILGEHDFQIMGGTSTIYKSKEYTLASGKGQTYGGNIYHNLASNTKEVMIDSYLQEENLASFFGRVNYKFMDRYILTASLRADGSSLLASGHKWGYFPSVALAWRMNEEAFLKNIDNLSNLKLRLSWGESGQSAIDPYQTIGLLGSSTYSFNNELASGLYPKTMSNKNLTWETTSVFDLGVDFGLFNNRLSGSLDIYKSYTRNVLMNRKIPSTNGYSDVMENIGKTENFGIDITLNSVNIQKKNFTWTTDFTLSHNKEKIKELASGALRDEANSWFVGEAFQVFYDYKKIGIWQLDEAEEAAKNGQIPGDIKIQDTNDDGEITPEDRVIYSKRPKVTFGINNAFTIHDFEFSFFIYSRLGQWIDYEFNRGYKPDGLENSSNVDYWTPENPTNDFPRPNRFYGFGKTRYSSTLKYEKGSFVKIRDITLAYNLPAKALKNIGLDRVRIYATAKNFFTFSSIENYDPERGGGISFPMTKQLVFGVNLDF